MADNSSIPAVGEGPALLPCLMKAEVTWMSTVRGILNKLTVQKYTLLKTLLINSGITTSIMSPDEHGGEVLRFRRILLNNCQQAFGRENVKVAEIRQPIVTGSFNQDLGWRWNLGFIKFISIPLVRSWTSFGPGYQRRTSFPMSPEEDQCWHEPYIGWLKDVLATHPQMETRFKFMIHNLLDLRANNWVDLIHNHVKDKTILELISASDAEVLSLNPGASTSTNSRTRRAVQFGPVNRPDPHCW
ncbi:hypothetical protein MKX03_020043 [Papaver bracteatum]|nr:hypothetical protein MKX03_020043 [Papaver bracteatum]